MFVPEAHVVAGRLIGQAFGDPLTPSAVAAKELRGLGLEDALDLVLSALTVRAALRAAGDLEAPASIDAQAA